MAATSEGIAEGEVQVSSIMSSEGMTIDEKQHKNPCLLEIIRFPEDGVLPENDARAWQLAFQQDLLTILDHTLHHLDPK